MNYKKLNLILLIVTIISLFIYAFAKNSAEDKVDIEASTTARFCQQEASTIRVSVLSKKEADEKMSEVASRREDASRADAERKSVDMFCLAAVICQEAGCESDYVQKMVANVVMNRVASDNFPDTIYDVVTAYGQYGMMWKYGVRFPSMADNKMISHCYEIAERILSGERVCPSNVVYQAEFEQGSGTYEHTGVFYFCFE